MKKMPEFLINRRSFSAMIAGIVASPLIPGRLAAQEQVDRTIRVAVTDFSGDTMDPSVEASRAVVLNQLVQMYDTLLEIGPNAELIPGVAEAWSIDETGKVMTFNIRKGIQFHDGWGELTAADVVFSLNRAMSDKARGSGGAVLRGVFEKVEEVDPYTVRVYQNRVATNIPYQLSPHQEESGIIHCKRYLTENAGDDFEAQSKLIERKPIGSGPFKFVSRELGNSYQFEAVPDHWRNTPQFRGLEFLFVPEAATQMAMLRTGEVDLISVAGDQVAEAEGAGFKIYSVPKALNVWLNFVGTYRPPAEGKPTTDVLVRKALSLAIDRQSILQALLGEHGSMATTPLNTIPATRDINPDDYTEWAAEVARYDPEEARSLLAEAGYPNGFSGLKLFSYPRAGSPYMGQMAEIVVAQWAQIGVEATIVPIDFAAWAPHYGRADINDAFNAGDCSLHSSSARFDALGPIINMWLYEGGSCQLMKDAQLDADINEAAATIDDEKRQEMVISIVKRTNDSWLSPPMFDQDALYAVNPDAITDLKCPPGAPYLGRSFETMGASA